MGEQGKGKYGIIGMESFSFLICFSFCFLLSYLNLLTCSADECYGSCEWRVRAGAGSESA